MSFSNYLSKEVLNYVFSKTSGIDVQPTIYVALSTADPGDSGAGTSEPGAGAYARVVTAGSDWNAATDANPSVLDNLNAITFPEATAAWGLCTHFALYDAISGGNFLAGAALDTDKSPTNGDTPRFSAGELNVTLT